ncbi:MAG: BON domain-containing protein [Gammaproteobacteria bacterium]|nr:BON domain-containing protein [Gammaproteobacteria bacterium]MCF6229171.1 BON domain-containing protein [Gammaproteobacteria bacterium]
MRQLLIASIIVASFISLQGCAPAAVVGVAATSFIIVEDRRTTEAFLQDQTIKFRSNDAIYSSKEIGTQVHVNVISYNQQVLLTGEAPTGPIRDQVEAIVSNIAGVKKVYNEIKIQPNSRFESRNNDAMITAKVKGRILRNSAVDPSKIKVVTEHANVYLLGLVTEEEATASVEIAQQVDGVERVIRVFEIIEDEEVEEEREISPEELNRDSGNTLIDQALDRINKSAQ